MLKKRLIPMMLLSEGRLIKTINFAGNRDVGDPVQAAKVYSDQNADELVVLNVSRTNRTIEPIIDILARLSRNCFMPIAVGGGIRSIDDVRILIRSGADKVVINSVAYNNPGLLTQVASEFGSQAVVSSIDCVENSRGWSCVSNCALRKEEISLESHLLEVQSAGAGEILIQSIDRDGAMSGLDVDLLRFVVDKVDMPVIAASGVGNYSDLLDGYLIDGVDAIGVASLFHFTDSNPIRAKAMLQNNKIEFKVI
ncbi:MAG: imidazole glycerol phosphate synthase cyclase subunit [Gammaproteobacteria bacterium]